MEEQELHVWNVTEQLLESRVVKIYHEIDMDTAKEVTALLDVLSNDDPDAPIKLEICSPGGHVLEGLSIVDKIETIPNPVIAFDTGLCASMGTVISSACDHAFGTDNCQFLIHELSSGFDGKVGNGVDSLEFDKRLNERLFGILARKCGKTPEEIYDKFKYRDIWMTAQEAKAYGLIDDVLPSAKKNQRALKSFLSDIKRAYK